MDIAVLNNQLIEEIRKSVQDETILEAFRRVERDKFIPISFYDRVRAGQREWRIVSSSIDEKEWLSLVYTNRPITISINSDGYPNSSSSQPDLMALMIQSVHLKPGMRVLEIGTGTGYNAAIIAHIVGKNVVSVDINEELLDLACARIERTVGSGVTLLHVDGRNLSANLKDFNAIIVTGSYHRIEPSWIRALVPGGRIIINWITSLTKVMIEAEKMDAGLVGRLCEYGGDFMGLHDGSGVQYEVLPHKKLDLIGEGLDFRSQIENPNFSFFLQINMPSLQLHRYYNSKGELSYALHDRSSDRRIHFFTQKIKGDKSLWKDICVIHENFEQLGQPGRVAFSLITDEHGIMTFSYQGRKFQFQ